MKSIIIIVLSITFCSLTPVMGQSVDSIKAVQLVERMNSAKKPLVVNFWATYCVPCIEEIPFFESMYKTYKRQGVDLLFVSVDMQDDYPAKVQESVLKLKMTAPVLWLNEWDADYFCPLIDTSWMGAIPATLFINPATGYRKFVERSLTAAQLKEEVNAMLKP